MTQLQFIERQLWLNQLLGHHPSLVKDLTIDYASTFAGGAIAA